MRLYEFLLTNREQILMEWETFARSCAPASATMDVEALRDHASEMLRVIAADLKTSQDTHEQSEKSKGHAPATGSTETTAAEEHGAGRAESGFTVEQMVAEYRALRASVLRLWTREQGELKSADIEDLTRFNEAIDQALAESVAEFNENVKNAKEMFLGILGHDLRTPLGAIYTSARFMLDTGELDEPHRTLTERIAGSSKRTVAMVGDLLDFTRSRLGGGIPIVRKKVNLGKVLHDVTDEISAAHPERKIVVDTREEEEGEWDAARMSQALTNLIGNAVEHGAPGTIVTVELRGDDENVAITIHNRGAVIPADRLNGIFNPMKGSATPRKPLAGGPTGNLGLGLYIAERIVHGHRGRIEVESLEGRGTTFTVHLPRHESPPGRG
ncbi:MAG TPA: sensor histidine kinase [Longimicrobium sp.]|nr:sensor histidine kinase [Longimicrobium sp.]